MKSKLLKIFCFILILASYGSLLVYKIALPAADDIGRDIKSGETIFKTLSVLKTNFYSYTEPYRPAIDHHWLSTVVFYLVHGIGGFGGLVILKIIILLFAFSLLFYTAIKKADFWLVSFFSLPAIMLLMERIDLRSEMFSYLFIAVFIYVLFDLEEHPERNRIFWLIPLQLLWVNLHVFFFIGIMLVGGFLLEKIIRQIADWKNLKSNLLVKKLFSLLVLLIAFSFINPYGANGVFYAFRVWQDFPLTAIEIQSLPQFLRTNPFWDDLSVVFFMPMVFVLILSFILSFKRKFLDLVRNLPVFYFLAGFSTAAMSFFMVRGLALFGLMFLLVVPANSSDVFLKLKNWLKVKFPKTEKILKISLIPALIAASLYFAFIGSWQKIDGYKQMGIGLTRRSNDSAIFFKEQGLKGPIFNDTDIGPYLTYYFFPKEKVFVDNRFSDGYSASFFGDIYMPMLRYDEKWQEIAEKYNFNAIFFYHYDEADYARVFLANRMRGDPDWALVYADTYAVIFLKNTKENQRVIEEFRITQENIGEKLNYLLESKETVDQIAAADLFNLMGRDDLAMLAFKRVINKWPEKRRIWMIMGEMESFKDDFPSLIRGINYLEKAINLGQKTAEAYSFLGLLYLKTEQYEKAELALKKSLKINPERQDAKDLLVQVQKYLNP